MTEGNPLGLAPASTEGNAKAYRDPFPLGLPHHNF